MDNTQSAVSFPIVSSASFSYSSCEEAEDIFSGKSAKPLYSRMGNPTSGLLEQKMASLEGGVAAIATSSGMGAISMVVTSLCSNGDEVISLGGLFGGSYSLFDQTLSRFGIDTHFLKSDELDKIESKISPKTKVIYCESIGNPNLRLIDFKKVAKIANKHNIAFVIDNTLTPKILKPFELGADIVIYSTTKIISGNSSALGGIAIFKEVKQNDKFHNQRYAFLKPFITNLKAKALFGCAKKRALRDLGMSANAYGSYQTMLGLETLDIRNERVNKTTLKVVKRLQQEGLKVNYPSLENNCDNKLYKKYFKNGCSGMFTIDMGSKEKAFRFLNSSKLLTLTANLGDSRTLAIHVGSTICRDFNDKEKEFLGISDGLIRFSIGLEKPKEIIDDILACFKEANKN